MKIGLYPEDMLLEYLENRLNGQFHTKIKYHNYLQKLPDAIEFSEEFALKWKSLVEAAVKRLIADTFALRPFLFEVDGYTKRFCSADHQFWNHLNFTFSHRGAERLYEEMRSEVTSDEPLYPVTLPADALLISLCKNNFSLYSFAWFDKNNASWIIQALFVAWQKVRIDNVPWQYLFDNPARTELPLRDYLIERAADYLAGCNAHFAKIVSGGNGTRHIRATESLELTFESSPKNTLELFSHVEKFIKSAQNAIAWWSSEGTVANDDERFIAGAARTFGFETELAEFRALTNEYMENQGMEEQIYESILRNQTSD
ncbi:MAG: hypothetical protein PHV05_08480 [Candidatus Riflebacteria bacterium]|nr:hypothetical protein [Candidatus Riflebacteria bacterium]